MFEMWKIVFFGIHQYGMSNNTGIWQSTFPNCPKTLTCGEWFWKKSVHDASRKKLCVLVMWRVIRSFHNFLRLKTRLPIAMQEQVPRLQTQRLHYSLVHTPIHFFLIDSLVHSFVGSVRHSFVDTLANWFQDSQIHWFVGSIAQSCTHSFACHSHLNHHVLNRSCPSQRQTVHYVCIAWTVFIRRWFFVATSYFRICRPGPFRTLSGKHVAGFNFKKNIIPLQLFSINCFEDIASWNMKC